MRLSTGLSATRKKLNCSYVNATEQPWPWQHLVRVQGFSGDGGPAVVPSPTHECSAEKTNKLNLSPAPPPPPPLTSLTHTPKSPTTGQRSQTKKVTAICPVQTTASAPSAHPLRGSSQSQ